MFIYLGVESLLEPGSLFTGLLAMTGCLASYCWVINCDQVYSEKQDPTFLFFVGRSLWQSTAWRFWHYVWCGCLCVCALELISTWVQCSSFLELLLSLIFISVSWHYWHAWQNLKLIHLYLLLCSYSDANVLVISHINKLVDELIAQECVTLKSLDISMFQLGVNHPWYLRFA